MEIVMTTDGVQVTAKAPTLGELATRLEAMAARLRAACMPVGEVYPNDPPTPSPEPSPEFARRKR